MRSGFIVAGALALLAFCGAASAELSRPAPAPPPRAPAAQPADDAEAAFAQWLQPVVETLDRAGRATQPFMSIDFNFAENDVEAARAAIREMAQHATAARGELAAARATLDAIGPFSHPRADPQQVEVSVILLRDSRSSIDNMDNLLADMIAFADAVERRDVEAVERISPRVERAALVLIQSQATMLRARQRLVPAASSTYHRVGSMAAMYDGMAALLAAEKDFDVAAVEAAAASLDRSLAADRAAQIVERASVPRRDPNYDLAMQIFDARVDFANVCEHARNILAAAVQEAHAGTSTEDTRFAHIDELGRIEYEMQELNRRQVELYARLVQ